LLLDDLVETSEQWRRRKAVWAMCVLKAQGVTPTLNKVRHLAAISGEVALSLNGFILEQVSALYD